MLQMTLPVFLGLGVLALSAPWWVGALFFGLKSDGISLAVEMVPIMCATFGINILASASVAGHYARNGFLYVEGAQLAVTVTALCLAANVTGKFGILGFVCLLLGRAVASFLVVGISFLQAKAAPVQEQTRTLWVRMAQILSGSVVFKLGSVIDRMLGSLAVPGALTALGVGQQIIGSTAGVSERVLARPLLVAAGARARTESRGQVLAIYHRQLRIVALGAIVGLLVAIPFALIARADSDLSNILRLRAFGPFDVILLMALTAAPAVAGQLSSSLMYAIGDTRTISRLALLSFVVSTVVKVVGFLLIGVYAIVAGVFLYQILNWLFLHVAAMRALRAPVGPLVIATKVREL
jgi:putative peptidoglycan lipid II flippase